MEDLTGKQLGQYRIVAPLGEGGMAAVYKAYQASVDRYVALKILPRHYAASPNFVARFKREAQVIAGLEHPSILPVYDYGEADDYTYIVMRYVEGGTLADLLKGQPLPSSPICPLISQVAAALDYAHSKGVVHRDVKPSNVLLDEQGNCLLSDFGMAKILESTVQLTATSTFSGTPTYASPEQALGRDLDGRSDVYSLGVVLYEMATGRPPFAAETPMAVLVKHIHDPLPLPRAVNPALSETVERVILKALAKEPEERYQKAGEMAQALTAALKGEAPPARAIPERPGMPPEPELRPALAARPRPQWFRKVPAWGWVAGGLIALCLIVGLLGGGIALIPSLMRKLATATLVAVAGPTASPTSGATLSAPSTAKPVATVTPQTTATASTSSPTPPPTATATASIPSPTPSPTRTATASTPSPTPPPTGTPVLPSIQIVRQFDAPGLARSIAWDGTNLWVAEGDVADRGEFLKLDEAGNTTEVYVSDITMWWDSLGGGMLWMDSSLWLSQGNSIYEYKFEVGNMKEMSHISLPPQLATDESVFNFFGDHALAWDGQSFWVNEYSLFHRISTEGASLTDFVHPKGASALAWDGDYLWAWVGGALEVVNTDGGCISLASFTVPVQGNIYSLAWDGQYLWALSGNKIYQLDIREVRAYVAEQYRLRAQTAALTEVLRQDPEVEADRVKVVNNTPTTLTITFEKYKYAVKVPSNTSQTITPPENAFVAEVPDLPSIRGSYISLSGCTWTFQVVGPTTP